MCGATPAAMLVVVPALLLAAGLAEGQRVVNVDANATQIRAALASATTPYENLTINIGPGLVDLGDQYLRVGSYGVSLLGAGINETIIAASVPLADTQSPPSCYAAGEGQPLLLVAPTFNPRCSAGRPAGAPPTVIKGITFRNLNPTESGNPPYTGPEKGVAIWMPGESAGSPSVVRACSFEGFFYSGGKGFGIEFGRGRGSFWSIEASNFDLCKHGIFLNNNNNVQIASNTFTRFRGAVADGATDTSSNLTITSNNMDGAWNGSPPLVAGGADGVFGVQISGAAASDSADRNVVISNNQMTGVTNGVILLQGTGNTPPPNSLNNVNITTNSFDANQCPCCFITTCATTGVDNRVPDQTVSAPNNWWGNATGPATPPLGVEFEPWIADYTPGVCPTGFCPTDVVQGTNNSDVAVITRVDVTPRIATPGSVVTVTVTLAQPLPYATFTVTSQTPGITCEPVSWTGAVLDASTTCSISGSTPSGFYSLLATVTDQVGVATSAPNSEQIFICTATLWHFQAPEHGCRHCGHSCSTGLLSCSGCTCGCHSDKGGREYNDASALNEQPAAEGASYRASYRGGRRGCATHQFLQVPPDCRVVKYDPCRNALRCTHHA